jgi:AraC family ethanolamine operon transcriptional activator
MTRLAEPLTLQELCRICGRSSRSLVAQFTDALGITPMAYFKLQRLNGARRALKAADPRTSHVVDIAGNFGFYHMGHFAVDYHELFGVHPSVTLATMPRRVETIDEGLSAAPASSQGE